MFVATTVILYVNTGHERKRQVINSTPGREMKNISST